MNCVLLERLDLPADTDAEPDGEHVEASGGDEDDSPAPSAITPE